MSKLATAATYAGSAGSAASGLDIIFGLTASQWSVVGVIGGLLIGLIGYLTNLYFKHQHLLIARQTAKANPDG